MIRSRRLWLYLAMAAVAGVFLIAGVPAGTVLPVGLVAFMLVMHLGGHGGHGHGGPDPRTTTASSVPHHDVGTAARSRGDGKPVAPRDRD